jgi:hypothetical protein
MAVKHEIKSQLAKLLATEDLVVEHRHVETAQFNVQTRVLTLPLWEKASNIVYDMLVGHEVGHALFTPNEDPPRSIPHQFLNIVEDARIEKLMKRKYMGLAKTFYGGYRELSDEDFFCLEGEDVSKMNLADRANLWFKIGNYIDIKFTDEEQEIIDMISETETFADVILAAEVLYKFCKTQKQEEKVANIVTPPKQQGASGQQSEQTENQSESNSEGGSSDEQNDESSDSPISESPTSSGDDAEEFEPETITATNLEENLKELVKENSSENIYLELPKLNLDSVVVGNDKVHLETTKFFECQGTRRNSEYDIYEKVDSEFVKFKRSAQKEVNYLVKEFECKKAADSYARATTARTGVLDCSKLHTYKYNEDLFKKVTTLADGKNHGLIFVLDWSGSMNKVLLDTLKQLYNLIWFCKKCSIPFDVYAFTNEWNRSVFDYETGKYETVDSQPHYVKEANLLCVPDHFSMLNILTSKVSTKEMETQMLNIWRIAYYYSSNWTCGYSVPERMGLSGTPLNEAFVALHQILPKFQRENKLQKVQCIVLTDGEAAHLVRHVEFERKNGDIDIGARRLHPDSCIIRDRKLGTTYQVHYGYHEFADTMLKNLRDNFPYVNFIGIRVLESRDANSFMKLYYEQYSDEYNKIQSEWKKQRSFTIKTSGYHAYFGLSATSLSQDSEFEVDDGATKAKIKTAFIKSLKTKKLNKKVLGEFISLVA